MISMHSKIDRLFCSINRVYNDQNLSYSQRMRYARAIDKIIDKYKTENQTILKNGDKELLGEVEIMLRNFKKFTIRKKNRDDNILLEELKKY